MAVPFEHDPTSSTSSATSPESLAGRKGGSSFLGSMFRSTSRDRDRYRNKNKNKEQQKASFDDKSKQDNHPQAPHDKEAEHEETTIPLSRKSSQKPSRPNRLANMVSSKKEVVGAVEDEWPMFSGSANDYEMGEVIGYGATSVVRMATFKPLNQVVAVKVLEFEGQSSIELMRREVQLMSLSKHPNILRVRGDWVSESNLCIACRFIPPGSLLDIMEFAFREGLDEATCATILKQAGEGMSYLHVNGWLHRDIKAGNLLVDQDGTILISDFGCSSQVFQTGNPAFERRTRKSFVGTPCWMAPEVVEQKPYDTKADIWSFGITALEIANGRAPRSLYTPAQILMKTLAENPPTLDLDGLAHTFSKNAKDMIDTCLKKDPILRPTAEKLLLHPFFKQAKRKQYLIGALLAGLPRIQDRQTRQARNSLRLSIRPLHNSVWDFGQSPLSDQFKDFTMRATDPPVAESASSRQSSTDAGETEYAHAQSSRGREASSFSHRKKVSISSGAPADLGGREQEKDNPET